MSSALLVSEVLSGVTQLRIGDIILFVCTF